MSLFLIIWIPVFTGMTTCETDSMGFPRACREAGIIPRIQALLKAFRARKLPVIYVVAEYDPLVREPVYGRFYEYMSTERPNAPNTKGVQVIPELTPAWGEPVLRNWNVGIFSNSRLDEALKQYGAETLVMVGVATNLVVHIGAVQATDHGYSVIVPEDAVTTNEKEAHEYSINKVLPLFAQITATAEVLARI